MKGEIRDATIALNEAETENAMTGIKLNKQRKMLLRQEAADVKERNDAIAASNKIRTDAEKAQLKIEEDERKRIAKERLDSDMASAKSAMAILDELNKSKETPAEKENREYLEKKAILEANNLSTEDLETQHWNKLNDINLVAQNKQYEDDKKIAEAKLAQKKAIKDAEENLLMSALSSAKSIFSQNKAIQKGVLLAENGIALAKLTMNTIEAVSEDNVASPLTFGMPWAGVHIGQGALGAANIISATSKGLAALGGGSAGSAPSMGSVSGGATTAPQFNVVGNSGANQLAQTLGREQPPIKTYVVAGDVSTGQSLNRNIITNASLG